MDNAALAGEILPPDAPAGAPSAASVALAKRISRGSPLRALEALTEGAIGEAAAVAASYADDAISAATRAADLRDWAHFADWCKAKNADNDELPVPSFARRSAAFAVATHVPSARLPR